MHLLTNTKRANLTVLGTHRRQHQICIGAYDNGTSVKQVLIASRDRQIQTIMKHSRLLPFA